MKKVIALVVIVSLSANLFAQSLESVDWGAFQELSKGTSYQQAVGFDSDTYYFIRTDGKVKINKSKVWLEGYSSLTNTFEQSNEILLPSVSGVQTGFEKLYYRQKKLVLFSSARNQNRNQIILYVSYLKPDGTLKNKPKEIAAVPLSNIAKDGFNIFLSKDEKNIVIESHKTFKKYNGDKLNTVILDFNLAEVFKTDIVLEDKFTNKEFIVVQRTYDDGKYIFLAKSELINTRRSSTSKEYNYVLFIYNTAKKSMYSFTVTMPKFKVDDAKYVVNKDGNVVVGGFVRGRSLKFENEKQGMFFKRYNPNTLKIIPDLDLKSFYMKFPREFLPVIENPLYGETKSYQYAYRVNSVEELDNGGYVILTEQKWTDDRTVIDPKSKLETGIQYFYYNNIMAGGINKKGKFTWIKIYPKLQATTNDNAYYSSYEVITIKNKIKLFYNGNEKNLHTGDLKKVKPFTNNVRTAPKGMAGVYSIYWDGSYERDPMFTGKDNKVVMIPCTLAPNSIEYSIGVTNGKEIKFGSFVVE